MKKYVTTDGKTCREILMPNEYEDLPVSEKAFYTHQWQRWDSGWVNCDEPRVKLTLEHRFVYKLIDPIEKPLEGEEKANYSTGLTDGAFHGWNLAIYECVKVLNNRLDFLKHTPNSIINQSEVTCCIDKLLSLRK